MIKSLAAVILSLFLHVGTSFAGQLFAVALTHTPVLNTPGFGAVFGGNDNKTLLKDECGQLRTLEFVALPGAVFRIEAELKDRERKIYQVETADYPYPAKRGYFVDARFVSVQEQKPAERAPALPAKEEIIRALKMMVGSRYVWGGNSPDGVAELLSWYPPAEKPGLSPADKNLWILAGVDCSGLLYNSTGGYTPRNTGALVNFGTAVMIAKKSPRDIAAALRPLDLLVWPGHVLIVIDNNNVIESHLVCGEPDKGVRIRPLADVLTAVMKKRKPVDAIKNGGGEFVVRRWYGFKE